MPFNNRRSMISIIFLFFALSCSPMKGCVESEFVLAPESRLPKWFSIPAGKTRADIKVTMTYYIGLSGRTATFKLLDVQDNKIAEVDGSQKGNEPQELKHPPAGFPPGYPSYEIITVNG